MKARHHMALAIALWGLAAGVALGITPERSSGFQASLTSFNYSNALPIRTAFNQLRGDPPSGGNLLTSHSRIEVSYGLGAWQFGTYWRRDYDARFDRDTAQLLYARQNHARIATGRDYTLDIEANQVAGFGASVARTYTFDDARLGVRVVGDDAALRAGERDRAYPELVQRHREQRHRDAFAAGEQHVELTARRVGGDLLGQPEQLINNVTHR